MNHENDLKRHRLVFGKLLEQAEKEPETIDPNEFRPSLTISRTSGARAVTLARKLADYLDEHSNTTHGWTLYDKDLVKTVIRDNHLPIEVEKHMPEDELSLINKYIEGLMVGTTDKLLFECTVETIRKLGHLGHTIVVGRGANIINRELRNCFHIRLVGSWEKRLHHVMNFYGLKEEEALDRITTQDRGRERYVKSHFGIELDDPTLYHLVVNTDHFGDEDAVRLVGEAFLGWSATVEKEIRQSDY